MVFWTLSFLVIIVYLTHYYFKKNLNYFRDNDIPYLPGWPFVGNMLNVLLRRKHFIDVTKEIYNVNPEAKYIGGFNFTQPIIMLRDLDLIKNVAIKNFEHFQDHRIVFDASIDKLMGGNIFNLKGEIWRQSRNILSPAFTSKKMKAMYDLMVECGERFIQHMEKMVDENKKSVDMKDLFTKYTNDVIATCAFGVTVDSLKNPKNDFYTLGRKVTSFDGFQTLKFFIAGTFPKLTKLLKLKFVSDDVKDFFEKIVSETIALRDKEGITRPDMLQLLMDARNKEYTHLTLDITYITAQVFIFFFGGFDTTSTQMCIIAHELAINPDVQKKLQNEIDNILGETNGNPTYEAIHGMLYLDAVFYESMRLHSQVAAVDRVCTKSFQLPPALPGGKPFNVRPGMNVWIPAVAIHQDPNYYDDPMKFDPERYYDKKVSINDVMNLGFGIGPRSCIGNRFAILETKILIFFLLSKFNLKPNAKTCIPFEIDPKIITVRPKGGFVLAIEPRNKIS